MLTAAVCAVLLVAGLQSAHGRPHHHLDSRSAELSCHGQVGWMKCETHDGCVHSSWICDGVQQCGDGSDEPPSCAVPQSNSCPTGYEKLQSIDDSCYKFVNEPRDWKSAQQYCAATNAAAHLLFVNSASEQTAIEARLRPFEEKPYWIGGERFADRSWTWQYPRSSNRGSVPMTYRRWAEGEPNDDGNDESCIALMAMDWWNGRWNDDSCLKPWRFICETVSAVPQSNSCPTGYEELQSIDDSCYKFVNEPRDWKSAQQYCAASNAAAHLLFVNSASEQTAIEARLRPFEEKPYWIGGERFADRSWTWQYPRSSNRDSVPMTYRRWASGEPNDEGNDESCIALMAMDWWNGRWNDDSCLKPYRFICETDRIRLFYPHRF